MVQHSFRSLKVRWKQNILMRSLTCELHHELPNDLKLRIFGNIREISNLSVDITHCPISFPKIKIWQQGKKTEQNQLLNFPKVLLYLISSIGLNICCEGLQLLEKSSSQLLIPNESHLIHASSVFSVLHPKVSHFLLLCFLPLCHYVLTSNCRYTINWFY